MLISFLFLNTQPQKYLDRSTRKRNGVCFCSVHLSSGLCVAGVAQMLSQTPKMNLRFAPQTPKERRSYRKTEFPSRGVGARKTQARAWTLGARRGSLLRGTARKGKSSAAPPSQGEAWPRAPGGEEQGKRNRPHLQENTPPGRVTYLCQNSPSTKNWSLQEASYVSHLINKIPVIPYPISFRKIRFPLPASCL